MRKCISLGIIFPVYIPNFVMLENKVLYLIRLRLKILDYTVYEYFYKNSLFSVIYIDLFKTKLENS